MPRDRLVMLVLLALVTFVSLSVLAVSSLSENSAKDGAGSNLKKLSGARNEYLRIIEESEAALLTDDERESLHEKIATYRTSAFTADTAPAFGSMIESLAGRQGLDIVRIHDISTGFQFVTEGRIQPTLSFLQAIETHPNMITVPVCSLSRLQEHKWRLTIQCFPVFLDEKPDKKE